MTRDNPTQTQRRNDLARDIFERLVLTVVPIQHRDDDQPGDALRRACAHRAEIAFIAADTFIAAEAARDPNILDQMGMKP